MLDFKKAGEREKMRETERKREGGRKGDGEREGEGKRRKRTLFLVGAPRCNYIGHISYKSF